MENLNTFISIRRDLYADTPVCLLDSMVTCIGVDIAAENKLIHGSTSYSLYYLSFSNN